MTINWEEVWEKIRGKLPHVAILFVVFFSGAYFPGCGSKKNQKEEDSIEEVVGKIIKANADRDETAFRRIIDTVRKEQEESEKAIAKIKDDIIRKAQESQRQREESIKQALEELKKSEEAIMARILEEVRRREIPRRNDVVPQVNARPIDSDFYQKQMEWARYNEEQLILWLHSDAHQRRQINLDYEKKRRLFLNEYQKHIRNTYNAKFDLPKSSKPKL